MGSGKCRFEECRRSPYPPSTNEDHYISFPEGMWILCGLWSHYAEDHNVHPPAEFRRLVMGTNPDNTQVSTKRWRGGYREAYFVEFEGGRCNHEIGSEPDIKFIKKMNYILSRE